MKLYIGIDPSMNSTGLCCQTYDDNGNKIYEKFYIIKPDKWHGDTGASFLWDILKNGWNITKIKMSDYIEHYGRGSFAKDKKITVNQWLEIHKDLWK